MSIEVGLRAPGPEMAAMVARAERWAAMATDPDVDAAALDACHFALEAAGDAPWRDGAMIWAGTHYGDFTLPSLSAVASAPPGTLRRPGPWPWLEPLLNRHARHGARALVLGGACGGASLSIPEHFTAVTVLDAAPYALALGDALSARLRAGAPLRLPVLREPWRHESLPLALPVAAGERLARCTWMLADAVDPPLAAGAFDLVLALGLLDSVRDPWFVLQQSAALVAPHGLLVVAAPWCDRPDITPAGLSLTAIARAKGHHNPTDALVAGAFWSDDGRGRSGALDPPEWPRCLGRRDGVPWRVRSHDRMSTLWALDVAWFRAPGTT